MAFAVRRILVPTDFSSCAQTALAQKISLAHQYGAELHLLHVMSSHDEDPYSLVYQVSDRDALYRQQHELCAGKLAELLSVEAATGLVTHRHLRRAFSIAPAIMELVEEKNIDCVVIGGHGRRGVRRFLLGSVAEEVVRLAPCPVLTVREQPLPDGPPPRDFADLSRILVPVDFSEHSRTALGTAKELAATGTRLELVHVVEIPVFPNYYDVLNNPGQEYAFPQIALKVEETIARFVQDTPGPDVECEITVLEGAAANNITDHAAQAGADLIVIATHGLTGFLHLLLGSVTEKVVRSAPCPVLTLKSQPRAAVTIAATELSTMEPAPAAG